MSRQVLHLFNAGLLFLGTSLYLGTGWSLVMSATSPMLVERQLRIHAWSETMEARP